MTPTQAAGSLFRMDRNVHTRELTQPTAIPTSRNRKNAPPVQSLSFLGDAIAAPKPTAMPPTGLSSAPTHHLVSLGEVVIFC